VLYSAHSRLVRTWSANSTLILPNREQVLWFQLVVLFSSQKQASLIGTKTDFRPRRFKRPCRESRNLMLCSILLSASTLLSYLGKMRLRVNITYQPGQAGKHSPITFCKLNLPETLISSAYFLFVDGGQPFQVLFASGWRLRKTSPDQKRRRKWLSK